MPQTAEATLTSVQETDRYELSVKTEFENSRTRKMPAPDAAEQGEVGAGGGRTRGLVNKDHTETGANGGGCSRFPNGLTGVYAHVTMGHCLKPRRSPSATPQSPSAQCHLPSAPVCRSLVGITVKRILLKYIC